MSSRQFLLSFLGIVVALSVSATVTLGGNILLIVNDPTLATYPNDVLIGDFLEGLGHTVTYFDDDESEADMEAAAAAADLVWISESVGSGNVNTKITEVETPMVVGEPYAWDEMGMTLNSPCITSDVATTDIEIINPSHFLAAGLSGTVTVLTDISGPDGVAQFANGKVGGQGTSIARATLADGQTYDVIVVYEKGAELAVAPTDGSGPTAADIRIGMFFHYYGHTMLNDNAFALMEAAVRYVLAPIPQARNPEPADGSLHEDTWASLSWTPGDFAVSHDVYVGDSFDTVNDATYNSPEFRGNQTSTFFVIGFPGYPYPDGLVPGTTYYWRIDEINPDDPNSPWKGHVWSFSVPPKTAYNPDPSDGAESVDPSVVLTWTPGFGSKLHTVYFGDNYDEVDNATVGLPTGTAKYTPSSLKLAKTYYWRVDEFDGFGTYKGDVWSFTTLGGVGSPNPADGAVGITQTPILTWSPGAYAESHEVYFGADPDAVRNATIASSEYKGTRSLGDESYDPGKLAWETSYYWRIDEVNNVHPDSPWTGKVWSFTTADFAIVDDFESYTDDDAAGEAIWQSWIDGFGVADNGAQVGYLMPPYAEQSIVHGGAQSMPLVYDNTAPVTNSEAGLTLTNVHDWTEEGVAELSLWFRGDTANAAEPLYVAVSNAAGGPVIVAYNDPSAATNTIWTQWIVPLQTFADQGINLLNVDKIAIGLGSKGGAAAGGTGTLYIDDIRLNRP
jgi:hypothetical protein